jgi:hypothetical protein
MRTDLLKIKQLAAVAAWQTPLGDEIHELVSALLYQFDEQPDAVIVELDAYRAAAHLRAA